MIAIEVMLGSRRDDAEVFHRLIPGLQRRSPGCTAPPGNRRKTIVYCEQLSRGVKSKMPPRRADFVREFVSLPGVSRLVVWSHGSRPYLRPARWALDDSLGVS